MSRTSARSTYGRRAVAASALCLVAAVAGPLPHAVSAVPPATPIGLAAQQPNSSTAVLTWEHVASATRYDVQVDDTAGFVSPEVSVSTVSRSYAPTLNLKSGTQYWRVRAYNATGDVSGYAESTFTKAAVEVPVLVSPVDGTSLQQPADPPVLTWNPSPGATSYLVEVDGDIDFVGSTSYEVRSTSLVVPDPLAPGDWFWRVVAAKDNNLKSQPSATRSFVVAAIPAPKITSPPDDPDHELQDVVLDWEPVAGAVSYEVEVATNTDFSDGSLIDRRTGIRGSRFSPSTTYDNNQYYWRVRAVDTAGQPTPWTEARYNFNRTWPMRPVPVYPAAAGAEEVPAPLYFQWEPIQHASEYELQVGTQENFSVGTYRSCRVAGTTYTPGMFSVNSTGIPTDFRENEVCTPVTGEINYWRVRGLDRPFVRSGSLPGVKSLFSAPQAFVYAPDSITNMTPRNGAVVDVPTLSWTPVVGAQTYSVVIKREDGVTVDSATTYATTYTPRGSTRLPAGRYTWTITGSSTKGPGSLRYTNSFEISGALPTTNAAALTPLTPTASTPGITTVPSLTWEPMAGAAYYKVNVGNASDTTQVFFAGDYTNLLSQPVPFPAMTDISDRIALAGQYDWQVEAFDKDNVRIGVGPEGRFTVQPIKAVTGHAVALGGQQLDANYTGPKNPCTESTGQCSVPATPVLKWTPDPRVAYYMVYVSEDASFTNILEPENTIPATVNSMYAPALDNLASTYADNQAGKAYYWHVRPCRNPKNCGPDPMSERDLAQGTFTKRSPGVTGLATSDPSGGEITFTWDDYYDTNQATAWAQTGERSPQAAKQYRIEVTVNGVTDRHVVDQTTFTAPDRLYPEGTLEWRVQAIDSDDNGLTWSATRQVVKRSPQVTLRSPVASAQVAGTSPFRWDPQAFSASYDVEINRNEDTTFSSGTRVASAYGVRTAAFTPFTPLPTSTSAYVWRVRRIDASGHPGPWSQPGRFTVTSDSVNLLSPSSSASVPPNGPVMQWQPVAGATTYDVVVTPLAGQNTSVNATTVATAFAPQGYLATGAYRWTVTARDVANAQIGQAQSTFTVDAQIAALQAPSIESPGGTGIGKTLSVVAPQWNMSGVETTYQWLRGDTVVYGATGTTYVLSSDDFGRSVTVRATGRKAGYLDGVSTSQPVATTAGDAVNNLTPPTISGNGVVGSYLTANPGTWSGGWATTTSFVWLRDGQVIDGATSSLYLTTAADGGKQISIRVTARQTGFADGTATSSPLFIQALMATSPVQLSAAGTGVGATLTAIAPTWNQTTVDTTYQWLRDGQVMWSATGNSYTVSADDVGKTVTVRATGRKAGFPDATSTSNGIVATRGGAPSVVSPPSVTGTARVGNVLTALPGEWTDNPTFSFQWLRNGQPIANASGSTYFATAADAAAKLSVKVTAAKAGREDGVATSPAVTMGKLASTTTLGVSPFAVTKRIRAKLAITVAVSGVLGPTGTLVIKDGKKKLKSLSLTASRKGVLVFKMPRLKPGRHKLKVIYGGSTTVSGSKAVLKIVVSK